MATAATVATKGNKRPKSSENGGNGKAPEGPSTSQASDLALILASLQTMRDGDFSVRLPNSWAGLEGKIADTFNDIAAANEQMAAELNRVGQAVGKTRETGQVRKIAEVATAVASGDLSRKITVDIPRVPELRRAEASVSAELHRKNRQLERLNRGLEKRVVERTEQLRESEELLRERADLLELATEAIFVRDMNGILLFWNSGAEALYGWKREEVLGKSVHQVLKTRFPRGYSDVVNSLAASGTWNGNLTQTTRDGLELTVACRKALKADGTAVLEINRDITAQLKAEDALRKTERLAAMGRVAGIIAHEINNPLESITNTFYLLRDHPSLDEEARYYAKLGEEELARVAHITRQTLGFYRESKHPVEVSLADLLDEILELQTRRMEFSKIVLEKRFSSRGTIWAFPVELRQVLLNLIGNAVQAMPDGGTLRLHVFESFHRHERPEVCVSISDTGTGIDAESAKHLFEPFFTTKSTKGTGLGLWISKGIVQKYGGTLRFRSSSLTGRNITCFQVTLPDMNVRRMGEPEPDVVEGSNGGK